MKIINTPDAPSAIGTYSQAVKVGAFLFMSGQIGLDPTTMQLVEGDFRDQAKQVFENAKAVAKAAGVDLSKAVKLTIYVCDMSQFPIVNEVMATYFEKPYPARAVVEVSGLPKDAAIEMDAILYLGE